MEIKLHPGTIPARPNMKPRPLDKELSRYDEYMYQVRGLAPKTRSMALRVVGRLLTVADKRFDEHLAELAASMVKERKHGKKT